MSSDSQDAESKWIPPPPPDQTLWNQQVGVSTVNVTEIAPLNKTLAIVSLVSGLIGLVFLGPILGVAGIATGYIAMKKIKENPATYGGRGMAISGIVLSSIVLILNAILLLLIFSANSGGNYR